MQENEALPTENMVIAGMEAMLMLSMTNGYERLTGCQQGSESARVCWAAMVAEMKGDTPRQNNAPSDSEILAAWAESHFATYDEDPKALVKFARLLFQRYEQALPQSPEIQQLRKDAERLDFMIKNLAWAQSFERDGSIPQYRLMTQNEDEDYVFMSGEDRYFNTPRDAIDAAMEQSK